MGLLGCAWVLCRVSADDESTTHAPTLWDDDWRPPAPTAHVEQQNTYELGAMPAWERRSDVDDYYTDDGEEIRTQCYSGSDQYSTQKVYCDMECVDSPANRKRVNEQSGRDGDLETLDACAGPWYCSKMEVCQLYHHKNTNDQKKGFHRGCMTVRSCANHSQCFPSYEDQERMNIQWFREWDGTLASLGTRIRDHGFKMFYGGMTFTTTCCVNRHNYRPGIDTPCNAASADAPRTRVLVVALFLAGVALARGND